MELSAYSPLYGLFIATAAFLTSCVLDKTCGPPVVNHRVSALDGLRGFLVIGVVIHHAAFWISRKRGGPWLVPDGVLSALGPACVILFFMTTAFLYYGKLLRSCGHKVDWLHIVLSRVLRLTPLCVVMAVCAFCIALCTKGFVIVDDIATLTWAFLRWASVGFGGSPDINGLAHSWEIGAGVIWTLKYEWLFYAALPLFGIVALVKPTPLSLIVSALLVAAVLQCIPASDLKLAVAFLGGIVAAYAAQNAWARKMCQGPVSALVFLACVANVLCAHRNIYGAISLVLLTIAFVIVACDNNLAGLLSLRAIRSFGDVGYSAYLLYGSLLYAAFHAEHVAPFDGNLRPMAHWCIVAGLTVALVVICRLTFRYVELPGMRAAPRLHAWLQKIWQRRTRVASAP